MIVASKKVGVISAVVVLCLVVSVVLFVSRNSNQDEDVLSANTLVKLQPVRDDTSRVSVSYPSSWSSTEISDQDIEDGFVFRFESYDPPALVSIRKESGLQTAAALSRLDVLDLLASNVAKSYPERFKGYKLESEKNMEIDGREAVEFLFTYDGPSGERVKQKLLIIKQNSGEAVYVSMQTKENDYESLEYTFSLIEDSILVL